MLQNCFRTVSLLFQQTIMPFGSNSKGEVKKMNAKLIATLIIVGVIDVAVVGLAVAPVASTTSPPNGAATGTANGGFFVWMAE